MFQYFKCAYCGIQFDLRRAITSSGGMFCSQTHKILSETESNVDSVQMHIRDMERAVEERR